MILSPTPAACAWFGRLPDPKQLVQAQLDSHFFRGHEEWLVETVSAYLDTQWRS